MKSRILSVKTPISAGLASAALLLAMTPVYAQEALIEKAKQACTDAALAKGFDLKEVVSSESTADGGAKVVLDLTRNGASAKLTCNLSKEGNIISSSANTSSATSSDTTGNATEPTVASGTMASTPVKTYSSWLNPWWGIIGSLLGLSLLLLLAKRLRETWYPTRWGKKASTVNIVRNSEVIVRHANHEGTDVRSGPTANSQVTRHLQNGTRVMLTGRQENHWVELTDGGWLPIEHLELEPHLV